MEDLEAAGFLPQAVVNALALLGWSFDDKTTIFTVDELVEGVLGRPRLQEPRDLRPEEAAGHERPPPAPDAAPTEFDEALVGWLRSTGYIDARGPGAEELVRASAPLVKRKISTFAEYDDLAGWLFTPARDRAGGLGGADRATSSTRSR